EQDMRYMGGLRRYMPITYFTMWVGALALCGIPPFSGFYSKDAIIDAVGMSHIWGSSYAYWCVLLGVFVTATYTFRMMYLTFHGKEHFRVDQHAGHGHDDDAHHERGVLAHTPHESPWVVTLPLVLLAIPSLLVGMFAVQPLLYGNFFGSAIFVLPAHNVLGKMATHFHGVLPLTLHAVFTAPFWIAIAGIVVTSYVYLFNPGLADTIKRALGPVYRVIDNKFYFDEFYDVVFTRGSVALGRTLWKRADDGVIDGVIVNGSASLVDRVATRARALQSGLLYHYAFAMILGLILLLAGFCVRGSRLSAAAGNVLLMTHWPFLSLLIWMSIIGAVPVLLAGDRRPRLARWLALLVALLTLAINLAMLPGFNDTTAAMQFTESHMWIRALDVHYALGVDGIAMSLILLTTITTVLVIIGAWEVIKTRVHQYMAAMLVLQGFMIGVFAAD
ncbi:proton-translocating NADH-quinone oxidoreductase, chain L, partial [mine drainage metagenome]